MLGVNSEIIRRVAIAMYEGEINMVIHANGGPDHSHCFRDDIVMVLADRGPGIPDIGKAMQEGYSTARPKSAPWASAPEWAFRT